MALNFVLIAAFAVSFGAGYYFRNVIRDYVNKYDIVPAALFAQTLLIIYFLLL